MNQVLGIGLASILLYFVVKLIESLLHDFKYVFFLSSNSILRAIIIADIYAIFNNHVIKSIGTYNIILVDIVTVICVSISIWASMSFSQKNLKDYIYKFEISIKSDDLCEEIKKKFKEHNIPWKQYFYYYENNKEDEKGDTKYNELQVYAFTREHTKRVKNILKAYDYKDVKYTTINTSNYIDKEN